MNEDLRHFLPLSPAVLHILLCLAAEPQHGYGIMQEVARQSNGQYKLGPGTLYDNLQELMNQGLVEHASRQSPDDDSRRRYYRLTACGRRVLEADVERLKNVIRVAAVRLRQPKPRRA
jgi:DNA-binding PadR family transcriptional regulator